MFGEDHGDHPCRPKGGAEEINYIVRRLSGLKQDTNVVVSRVVPLLASALPRLLQLLAVSLLPW